MRGRVCIVPSAVAKFVTDVLDPKNWMIVTLLYLGWYAGGFSGISWALLVALFTAVIPAILINYGVRKGRLTDRHVGVQKQRIATFAFILVPVAAGVALMISLHAPPKLTGYVIGMLISVLVLAAITAAWKISIHCTVSSAAVCIVALTCTPLVFTAYSLVGLVAWSRVMLRDHTFAQVCAGSVLGALIAVVTHAIVR